MKPETLKAADEILVAIRNYVEGKLLPVTERMAETERRAVERLERLEARVAELERAAESKAAPDSRWLRAV
jgi:hypothetical protein